jgi:hypothetical protein
MRGIEIEVPDQSDVLPPSVLKESVRKNRPSVQSIIDSIPPPSSNYSSIIVPFRTPEAEETLSLIPQTPLSLFHLFFSFNIFETMAKNTNLKASKRNDLNNVKPRQRVWHDTSASEVGAFLGILLYMGYTLMPRIADYWNIDPKFAIHETVIQSMSIVRWEQIKRFLKISNPSDDEKIDTRGPDWWKKLEPLATSFRKASKKYWIPGSHLSVDEQLILFRGRSCHTMQIATKAAGVGFKIYSLCQENYLYDFLFSSKVSQKMS